uniref:Ditrans,polycis-polyprenyl diphosphate synthase ((2E,6E)-farnesyldiphosphate specific) n=1 Tax=Loa loa TaxID=7209 RepID=A0A1I7VJL7_LOALO
MWFDLDEKKTWWHNLAKYFLTLGPIPEHIAFIMDGNRRYSRLQRYSSFVEGNAMVSRIWRERSDRICA